MDSIAKKYALAGAEAQETRFSLRHIFPARMLRDAWYVLTHWETWDWRIKYFFIAPAWLWCCIRARAIWFFTPSNPTLAFGGFEGETKMEMYRQLPAGTYPKSLLISTNLPFGDVGALMAAHALSFPVAVKPDVGKMSFMFRTIHAPAELRAYHEQADFDYILQAFISYPLEVSIFYYRLPDQQKGAITGFVKKEFLQVVGDGRSTLWELILNYPRVRFRLEEMRAKHKHQLHLIPGRGEVYYLSQALNLSRGGKLVSLEGEKDDSLLKVFDEISQNANFYFGRYDVRCESVEALKEGRNFSILEYNGSGAEPHHVYGNGYTLLQACSILVWHWNMLCRISRMNARRGFQYWGFAEGLEFLRRTGKHLKKLKKLDSLTPES